MGTNEPPHSPASGALPQGGSEATKPADTAPSREATPRKGPKADGPSRSLGESLLKLSLCAFNALVVLWFLGVFSPPARDSEAGSWLSNLMNHGGLILLAAICSFFLTIIAALIKKWPWVLTLHAAFILLILSPVLIVMAAAFWDNVTGAVGQ